MVRISGLVLLIALLSLFTADTLLASYYLGFEDIGRQWFDVEKSTENNKDGQLCWAATASNMLAYTGWGFPTDTNFADADDIFDYFQDHWTNAGGNMYYGTQWWFDGINPSYQESPSSQVHASGGGFYPDEAFSDYYSWSSYDKTAMDTADGYLHDGYGVGLSLAKGDNHGGHAITLWGYKFDETTGDYQGIYVTDSDDDKDTESAPDELAYYDLTFHDAAWYLQDYCKSDSWHITEVHGLSQMPAAAVPIPSTALLLSTGLLYLLRGKRKFRP